MAVSVNKVRVNKVFTSITPKSITFSSTIQLSPKDENNQKQLSTIFINPKSEGPSLKLKMRGRLRIIDGDKVTWTEIPTSYREQILMKELKYH